MTSMLEALKRIEAREPASRLVRPPGAATEPSPAAIEEPASGEEAASLLESVEQPQAEEPPAEVHMSEPVTEPAVEPTAVEEAPAKIEPDSHVEAEAEPEPQSQVEAESEPAPEPSPTPTPPAEQAPMPGWDLARLLNREVPPQDRPYRDLAANVLSQLESGRPAAILFVAPAGSRRRTSNLTRLATVLAGEVQGGVLVVDVDLASPRLAETFGFDPERGVADVLLGAADWQELVLPTQVEGLFVLPGRPFPSARPPELPPFPVARLLDDLRRHYGLVLLDAGQSLPEKVAPWARFCDATYLLAGLGETTVDAANQAADLVEQAAGRVLGTVVIENGDGGS